MRFLLFVLLIAIGGCRAEDYREVEGKLDAPLRQKLETLLKEDRVETLAVLGRCSEPVTDDLSRRISTTGAEVQSTTGDIFAARLSSDRIVALAKLDFVQRLELSQTSAPLSP